MGDFVVISVLLLIVGSILYSLIRRKKRGESGCGCDCSKCGKGCPYQK